MVTDSEPHAAGYYDFLHPIAKNVPLEMRPYRQWVCWIAAPDPSRLKPAKILISPVKRFAASVNKFESWGTFESAVDCCKSFWGKPITVKTGGQERTGPLSGIGFVLTRNDPFTGVDLDACVDNLDVVAPWAMEIVNEFSSYTEYSPSNTGLRIFAKGKLPKPGIKRPGAEVYFEGRYLTITGHVFQG